MRARSCCLIFCSFARIRLRIVKRFTLKTSVPVFSADVRKAQKIERLRLIFPSSRSIFFGEPPELNQTRFVWMEFQPEPRQSFP